MSLYKVYGIAVGAVAFLIGVTSMFFSQLDLYLSDNETPPEKIRPKRIFFAILLILGGIMSITAVLFGWPHVRGYIVPPP